MRLIQSNSGAVTAKTVLANNYGPVPANNYGPVSANNYGPVSEDNWTPRIDGPPVQST